jgi:ubiquinone/menaquinone biosynthesis C-methylase UbiE
MRGMTDEAGAAHHEEATGARHCDAATANRDDAAGARHDEAGARYDEIAAGYARHWAPVIRPGAMRLLDDIEPHLPSGGGHILDIGTGTGTLALGAIERWPRHRVTGIDASGEMAAWAEREADQRLPRSERGRFGTVVAVAEELPFPDATFDLAMSSFVFQLVRDRAAALREAARVLRPGSVLAYVTWLRTDGPMDPPDRIFEEVLDEFGFDPPAVDPDSGDAASPRAAADGLRRAGFRGVRAREDVLVHRWTPRRYADFLEQFAEASLFDDLAERERRSVRHRLLQLLGNLRPSDLRLRLPIVYVTGRKPG